MTSTDLSGRLVRSAKRLVIAMTCLMAAFAAWGGKADGTLEVYWVDVEGGAATLIVTPAGESVLIDSGNPGGRDSQRIHRVATEMANLEAIDYLITTHFHLDHFGGAAELAALMPIKVVYDNGIPDRNPDNRPNDTRFPLLIKPYREMSAGERRVINPGDSIPLKQAPGTARIKLTCLATRRSASRALAQPGRAELCQDKPAAKPQDTSDNANSVVLLLELGDFRFFDAGDLTWNVEPTLVCPDNLTGGTVDVYQVTHHGLDRSNHPTLVHALAPTVTVMNNGVTKGCGAETFQTLQSIPSAKAHYQVHKNLRDDREHNTPDTFIANLERRCQANPIRLAVKPDGTGYAVSIPATGHRQEFATTAKP